jgi:tetratricopeptide (TPR) repeat protein
LDSRENHRKQETEEEVAEPYSAAAIESSSMDYEARAWLKKGMAMKNHHKYESALEFIDKALESKSDYADAYLVKGVILGKLGRCNDALQCYDKAIELNPNSPQYLYVKGATLNSVDKHAEALECYDKALELDPNSTEVWLSRAFSLQKLGNLGEALKCYEEVLRRKPKDAKTWCRIGIVKTVLGDFDDALNRFDKALESDPDSVEALISKSIVLERLGRTSEAELCMRKARALREKYDNMIFMVAEAVENMAKQKPSKAGKAKEARKKPKVQITSWVKEALLDTEITDSLMRNLADLNRIKAIIFNLEGVITNLTATAVVERFREYFGSQGKDVPSEKLRELIYSGDNAKAVRIGEISLNEFLSLTIKYLEENYAVEIAPDKFKELLCTAFQLTEGIEDLILKLKDKGFKLAILTNNLGGTNKDIKKMLDGFSRSGKLSGYFDLILTSVDIKAKKPQKEAFIATLAALRVKPQEAVFIDDQLENVKKIRRYKMSGLHYDSIKDGRLENKPIIKELLTTEYRNWIRRELTELAKTGDEEIANKAKEMLQRIARAPKGEGLF